METLQVAAPLLGVIVGGMLTGVTAYLRDRKERKRVIALALSDLLEVRHRVVAIEFILKKISSIATIQVAQLPKFRDMFESVLPQDPGLDERYNAAVSLLAGMDPVLAFSMRSRNALPKMFATLNALATANDVSRDDFASMENWLRTASIPQLTRAVEELARSHSIFTARRVRKLIKKTESLPAVVDELFEQISKSFPTAAM